MESRIAQALSKLFERHRIVFWYDAKQELRADFESLSLPDVEKLELAHNEYKVKFQVLRKHPEKRFLLYREGPQPADLDNWLLDVQLGHGEFRTDQVAIWLSELELGLEFADVVQTHAEFFQASKRKETLKKLLRTNDTAGQIRLKMLAVCANSEPRPDAVIESLLEELAHGRDERSRLIERCNLGFFLWEQLKRHYGYHSGQSSIRDFAIELFKSCYAMGTDGEVRLTSDALVFLKRWKDSRQFEKVFESLSDECAKILGLENDLSRRDFRTLLELDYFREIDLKILSDLAKSILNKTVSAGDVELWVRQRRQSHWYQKFEHLYQALDYAAQFMQALTEANLTIDGFADGLQRYSQSWYRIDQYYRKFWYHAREAGHPSLTIGLQDQIENLYVNQYLLKLNDRWQPIVDQVEKWDASPVPSQRRFFERWVKPFLAKDNKVCVVISDALRFEIGEELALRIRTEDRYTAEIEPALSMLPSYTQLGMAALLPHKKLAIPDGATGIVEVDGEGSQGILNRGKILDEVLSGRATAYKTDVFMEMTRDESREVLKAHDVVYFYHNKIDQVGDKLPTEGQTFVASEDALQDLIRFVKKLAAANANNILITSDHGFIYQERALEESDFSGVDCEGDQVLYKNRRFVFGKGLKTSTSLRSFSPEALGFEADFEVQIPKSINRLRLKGSGSRFVHGGASLQEVVIPVIKINKKRQSDTSMVDVEILRGSSSVITSGQLAVVFYQQQPVTEKMQPRFLRAGLFTEAGELISDSHELSFDLHSENPRERELPVRFVLSQKADDANGKEVILKLEERHAGTTHYTEYKSIRYIMRRSFKSDFDF